jgi:peptidoglycan/LPS O-acetylase OafA/YrhL
MKQEFRPDVEGLRAVAIVPILLFHLDSTLCSGGFVGVDIFFVISGFLITRMIVRQGEAFSFTTFYVRRFFRLFPALIVTLTATLVAGWKLLGPDEYARLARSAIAAAFGVSNLHFLVAVDYFDASSLSHLLLHTWSLGVEEQFYLLWPLLLLLTRRVHPLWLIAAATASLSFLVSKLVQPTHPQLVFYMMPFRMFEFAVGAALVDVEHHWRRVPPLCGALAGAVAAAMLAIAFTKFDGQTPWPGTASLVPVLATALLILAGEQGPWKYLLGHAIPRFIGRISYSLYLVHWPLITLYRSYTITEPGAAELVMLGLLSVALGAALFATVENPIRLRGATTHQPDHSSLPGWLTKIVPTRRMAVPVLAATSAAFLAGAGAVVASNGFPSRLDRTRVQFFDKGLTFAGDLCNQKRSRCVFGDRDASRVVYVIGDSHALNLIHGLDRLFRDNGLRGVALYDHGCLFAYETKRFLNGVGDEKCRGNVAQAYEYLAGTRDPIILAGDYAGYRNEIGPSAAAAPLRQEESDYYEWVRARLVASLAKLDAGKRTVIVMKQTYTTGTDLAKCLAQPLSAAAAKLGEERCVPLPLARVQQLYARADRMIDEATIGFAGAVTVDPKPLFCGATNCATRDDDGSLYFRDTNHLTNAGSDFLVGQARGHLLAGLARR